MWYFAWILGILLACSLGIINGLWLEQVEANELADEANKEKEKMGKSEAKLENDQVVNNNQVSTSLAKNETSNDTTA